MGEPHMGTVIGFVWLVIGTMLTTAALFIAAAVIIPNPVERARQRIEAMPLACFGLGLFVTLFSMFVFAVLAAARAGGLQLLGWILMVPALAAAGVGGAGLSRIAAARIRGLTRSDSGMASLVSGALSVSVAGWTPIVGWFGFFPVMLFISAGAGIQAILSRREVVTERAERARVRAETGERRGDQPGFLLPGATPSELHQTPTGHTVVS